MESDTIEVLKQLEAEDIIKPDALLGTLSVAEQQVVEIAKAISYDARVLIMDEPTAALASHEVGILTELMLRLKTPGHERFFQSPTFEATFGGGEAVLELAPEGGDAHHREPDEARSLHE